MGRSIRRVARRVGLCIGFRDGVILEHEDLDEALQALKHQADLACHSALKLVHSAIKRGARSVLQGSINYFRPLDVCSNLFLSSGFQASLFS